MPAYIPHPAAVPASLSLRPVLPILLPFKFHAPVTTYPPALVAYLVNAVTSPAPPAAHHTHDAAYPRHLVADPASTAAYPTHPVSYSAPATGYPAPHEAYPAHHAAYLDEYY